MYILFCVHIRKTAEHKIDDLENTCVESSCLGEDGKTGNASDFLHWLTM